MTRVLMRSIAVALLLGLAALPAAWAKPDGDPAKLTREVAEQRLLVYMSALGTDLPERVQNTLDRIPELPRKLLAIKYYLEHPVEEIEQKWAWSGARANWYKGSAEYRVALGELVKVRKTFAEMYPGYTLEVRIEIRSLASQVGKWNTTHSIAEGAGQIYDSVLSVIADSSATLGPQPDDSSLIRFRSYLLAFKPDQHPTVAVPGMSQHGQFRAFDFSIRHRRKVVAGTSAIRIDKEWDSTGWTQRLQEAICRASDRFAGPLPEPYEPWHYAYTP